MMKDATDGQFDVIVPYDATRFARDGVDILSSAKFLKETFGILVVDAKNQFDNRSFRNVLANFVHAGVSEHERLSITERTIMGRIRRAKEGKPWTGQLPIGRAWDKDKQSWYVTDRGREIADAIKRYVAGGVGTTELAKGLGVGPNKISVWVWSSQLAGEYKASFKCSEINVDVEVPVPGMPEVCSVDLIEKARSKLVYNHTNNKAALRKYILTGFLRCGCCGKSYTGRGSHHHRDRLTYYHASGGPGCTKTVPGEDLEASILDYLYQAFLDKPAFDKAVLVAAPSATDRKAFDRERSDITKQLDAVEVQINRLADAVAEGMDLQLLLGKQEHLKADRDRLGGLLEALEAKLASLPDPKMTQLEARLTRVRLRQLHKNRNWRDLDYDDQRQFLLHLFGETTLANGNGMFVTNDEAGKLTIVFKGMVDFQDLLCNGKPLTRKLHTDFERWCAWYSTKHGKRSTANKSVG
jgi:site-specific DNA recombinase